MNPIIRVLIFLMSIASFTVMASTLNPQPKVTRFTLNLPPAQKVALSLCYSLEKQNPNDFLKIVGPECSFDEMTGKVRKDQSNCPFICETSERPGINQVTKCRVWAEKDLTDSYDVVITNDEIEKKVVGQLHRVNAKGDRVLVKVDQE